MKACWDAAGEVIKAWATEGHAVALSGLGTMRFGLRSKSVEKVEDTEDSENSENSENNGSQNNGFGSEQSGSGSEQNGGGGGFESGD